MVVHRVVVIIVVAITFFLRCLRSPSSIVEDAQVLSIVCEFISPLTCIEIEEDVEAAGNDDDEEEEDDDEDDDNDDDEDTELVVVAEVVVVDIANGGAA